MGGRNVGFKFALTALLTAMAFYAWQPAPGSPAGKVPLGLDLKGGAELVYRIRVEELPEDQRGVVLSQAAEVIQKRLGVLSEAKVAPHGSDRILVQMPSADQQTVEDLKEKIRKSGRLEFRMVVDEHSDPEIFRRAGRGKEKGQPPPPGFHWYKILGERDRGEILVDDRVEMTGDGIDPQRLGVEKDNRFRDVVSVAFTPVGTGAMDRIAKKAFKGEDSPLNQRMAIILNDVRALPTDEERKREPGAPGRITEQGVCYSAPSINAPAFHGAAVISGDFTPKELSDLIGVFQAGSLPAPLELERQMQVGPSLGEDQMRKGLKACLWGTGLVAAFMAAYYLAPGLVAAVALLLNLVLLLGIMGGLGATLTLPGMAGIVLTLGMAVDANVLVFERIREELSAGKGVAQAIEAGYDRAFITILDSNLTTIISAVVLYALGSEQVQGFAVTLSLGLVASMFTSLVVTRMVFDLAVGKGWMTSFRMLRLWPATAIDFVKPAGWCIACSAILIAAGMIDLVGIQGRDMLATDFTGGRILQLRFAEGRRIADVRAGVARALKEGGYPHGADAQVISLQPAGRPAQGLPRDFEIITRNMDVDSDRVRETAKEALGTALASAPAEVRDAPPGRLAFDLAFTAPQNPAGVAKRLAGAGLAGAEVRAGDAKAARLTVPRRSLVEDFKAAFPGQLAPTAFQAEPVQDASGKVRLTFSLLEDKGLEPARRAAKETEGSLLDGELKPHPGGFHAAMEVPQDRLARAERLLRQGYAQALSDPIPRDDVVGSVVAKEAIGKTLWALVAAGAALIVYIAFRFEFKSGVAAVVAVIHDVLIVLGVLAVTHTQIDMTVIAALLTIIGFSVNDTIVVFDRVRENLGGRWDVSAAEFGRVVNLSVNQTLSRTVLTSFTVLISVIALFMGGEVFRGFAIAMLAGLVTGTYSTVFIAAPLVQRWRKRGEASA